MKRLIGSTQIVLALALLGPLSPSLAQAQTRDMVRFKITVSGKVASSFVIPIDPPIMGGLLVAKGTAEPADLLGGEVTFTDTHIFHLGVDGTPNRSTDGTGIFQGPGGDALFVNWDAVIRPTTTANVAQGIASFTGRGGTGKFAGVASSGTFTSTLNLATFEVTQVWEGLIALPKK